MIISNVYTRSGFFSKREYVYYSSVWFDWMMNQIFHDFQRRHSIHNIYIYMHVMY